MMSKIELEHYDRTAKDIKTEKAQRKVITDGETLGSVELVVKSRF